MENDNYKFCKRCSTNKLKSEFGLLSKSSDKLSYSCKLCLYARIKKWGKENITKVRKNKAKYKLNNKEKSRAYERNRRKTDADFKLKTNMRHRLTSSFKKSNTGTSIRYLDYTIQELRDHLESKFTKGMTWENYGKDGWEIDHIIPIVCFDINGDHTSKAFKACWSLSNLQPLWKTTKIAISYGEDENYIGNVNKNHVNIPIDVKNKLLEVINN
jgi:hypothetical protein